VAATDRIVVAATKIARKVAYYMALLLLVNFIMYSMVNLAPGNPMESVFSSPEIEEAMKNAVGLDEPFLIRFATWFLRAITLDFGFSYKVQLGVPVIDMIGASFLRTSLLILVAIIFSFMLASITAAVLTPEWKLGLFLRPIVLLISAIPVFLLCYWAIRGMNSLVLHYIEQGLIDRPEWFPLPSVTQSMTPLLPAGLTLALGDGMLADLSRAFSFQLTTTSNRRYVQSAKARGASTIKHGSREFSIEAIGIMASRLVSLLGGVVIVEKLFSIDGIGYLLWEAALERDYSVVVGIAFLSTLLVILVRLAADLYQLGMDPRVRLK